MHGVLQQGRAQTSEERGSRRGEPCRANKRHTQAPASSRETRCCLCSESTPLPLPPHSLILLPSFARHAATTLPAACSNQAQQVVWLQGCSINCWRHQPTNQTPNYAPLTQLRALTWASFHKRLGDPGLCTSCIKFATPWGAGMAQGQGPTAMHPFRTGSRHVTAANMQPAPHTPF